MNFYVPTRARPNCCTPQTLESYGVPTHQIILVIRQDEQQLYEELGYPMTVLPPKVEGLSATRQWIIENVPVPHCQIDDDITGFLEKPVYGEWKVRPIKSYRFWDMISLFKSWLDNGVIAASTQDRVGLARPSTGGYTSHTRIGQVIFIHGKKVTNAGWRFDRVKLYADQDMALQIVRAGYDTRVSNQFGHSMRPLREPGGCSVYRDQDCIMDAAFSLERLHKGLIKLEWRDKNGLRIPSRRIAWKKARQEGEAARRDSHARSR